MFWTEDEKKILSGLAGGCVHHTLCGYLCCKITFLSLFSSPTTMASNSCSPFLSPVQRREAKCFSSPLLPCEAGRERVNRSSGKIQDWSSCKGTLTLAHVSCIAHNTATKTAFEVLANTPHKKSHPRNRS